MPNFVQLGRTVAGYGRFRFFKMAAVHHLGFSKVGNFNCPYPVGAKMRHHTKFCADRSNRCGDMAVFNFSRQRPSAILDFQNLEILTARTLSGGQNASSCQILCRSVKALRRYGRFRFFKMAAVRHLGFVIRLFGPPTKCILVVSVTVQNLV